jgi:hypothetical protein
MRVCYHPPTPPLLESWGYGESSGQNPEPKGLIFKILQNKGLADFPPVFGILEGFCVR